ncbi:hypothetical protein FDECE_8228 [Fusarium decemcellulare]|nr:hypothetical protein FDECE_8228 [Fusarium decemcellulare]
MSSQKESSRPLEFNDLPLELRDLIWGFALPDRRVFHVKGVSRLKPVSDLTKREMRFHFHIRHPPPVGLHVCQESRAVALRKGFFLSPAGADPGVWFKPETDILYFDRNQRTTFQAKPNQPRMTVSGWDRVLNVGIEWRAFFRDTPRPSPGETTASYWSAVIKPLYAYMPHMQTVNYILPILRHRGGMMWGREPYRAQDYEAILVPLPGRTQIPWESTRNRGGDRAQLLNDIRHVTGLSSLVVTWKEVKEDIEKGFEEDDEAGESSHGLKGGDRYPPEIIGWWLLRDGIPPEHGNPQIQEFHT